MLERVVAGDLCFIERVGAGTRVFNKGPVPGDLCYSQRAGLYFFYNGRAKDFCFMKRVGAEDLCFSQRAYVEDLCY